MEAAVALREQPEIRELFEVLEGNGLKKERQEVETLINYLEGMESQFGEVIKELKEVRGQLEQIQDRGIKATAARLLDSAAYEKCGAGVDRQAHQRAGRAERG